MLEGKRIYSAMPCDGLIAGEPRYYELHVTGGIITIKDSKDVVAIEKALYQAKKIKVNAEEYLQYCIDEEDILS